MALTPGTRLGPYEIVSALGAGGMGEVYRARDTKLGRDVAVKVLPESVANDPDRIARFEREAKVLAALNHPNIAHIHGFEDSTGVPALVMELVEGPTLADRIARGAIALDDALPIAEQIASAFATAHAQGIVHRDLKPANVKVRPDGTVKVLDFGLAKALDNRADAAGAAGGPTGLTQSPTITSPAMMTGVGMLLGTAAYMSPEQAKAKPADKGSDVWAFGCVLFEMLTGKRAFDGEDVGETLAAVIRGEPEWAKLPRETPAPIGTLLRRTLEKDRIRRVAEFSTVLFLLGEAKTPTPVLTAPSSGSRFTRIATAVSVATAVVAIGVAAWAPRRAESQPPRMPTRFRVPLPESAALFISTNPQRAIALSSDGRRLVFSARVGSKPAQLYVRSLEQLDATPIRGTEGGSLPLVSPDGQWLAYVQSGGGGGMYRVPIAGGTPTFVCTTSGVRGATWLPDDTIVFADANTGLKRVPSTGGTPVDLTKVDPKTEALHTWPQALPDGRTVVFTVQPAQASQFAGSIEALRIDTGERRVLVEGGSMPLYLASGHLVFMRGNSLMGVPFDASTLRVSGTPVPVLDGTILGTSQSGAQLAITASGTMAYVAGGGAGTRSLTWVDRAGRQTPTNAPPRNYENPRLSPDGSKALVSITGGDGASRVRRDVWLFDFARSTLSRLTTEKDEAETATWTPDGRRIVYAADRGGRRDFVSRPADGSSAEELFVSTDRHLHSGSWTPDGQSLLAVVASGRDAGTFWLLREKPTPSARLFMKSTSQLQAPMLSPDGRWLAYASNETNRFEIYVQAFPGPGAKYQVSSDGGTEPRWSRSGRDLFFRNEDNVMAVTVAEKGLALQIGAPAKLFEGRFATIGGSNLDTYYDVSPDGQRFLMVKADEKTGATGIVVVQDFMTELKTRVTAK